MAAEQLSGTHGIRSLTDHDAVFRAFDSYPWTKDKAFMVTFSFLFTTTHVPRFSSPSTDQTNLLTSQQSGLHAILGDPNSPNQQGSPADMAIHARIFYYSQRVGVSIDFAAYQAWLAQHPDHTPPNILPPEYLASSNGGAAAAATPLLDWQKAAPKAELYVDRAAAAEAVADQPAYPMAFAEMIKLLQEGKEVPGIRQIPNTIIRNSAVKPVGARTAPRKPWEKDISAPSDDAYRLAALDAEFPPVEPTAEQPEPATA